MPDYKLGWDLQRRSSARYPRMGWDKARISIYSDPIVYEGTITGLRISAVDGTAFIDNLPYVYSSDFSAGVDGWGSSRGTVAGDIDSIGGEDNWLRLTIGTQNDVHYAHGNYIITIGKQYTVSFRYYIPSGQTVLAGVRATGATYQSTLGAATTVTYTWTATATNLRVYATSSDGSTVIQDAGGDDVFYIKDITISEITPYMDGNHQIEIYDSSNRMLRGVLKAAGTSEGLGGDILAGWDLTTWAVDGAGTTIVDNNTFTTNTYYRGISKASLLSVGKLYKTTIACTPGSGTVRLLNAGLTTVYMRGNVSGVYFTAVGYTGLFLQNTAATTTDVTTLQAESVTAPSSGATIVSAKAGETYNFSYKNPSFTYNAASYYVIIRSIR